VDRYTSYIILMVVHNYRYRHWPSTMFERWWSDRPTNSQPTTAKSAIDWHYFLKWMH